MPQISPFQKVKPASELTDAERISEAADILATAILRKRKDAQESHFRLDFMPEQSVHGPRTTARETLA